MIYYIGLSVGMDFFLNTTLREWAVDIVYGPLGTFSILFIRSLFLLFFPYLAFNLIRMFLHLGKKRQGDEF